MGSCVATCQVNRRQCENPFGASNIGSTKQKNQNSTYLNLIATWICHDENRQISIISACHIPTDR